MMAAVLQVTSMSGVAPVDEWGWASIGVSLLVFGVLTLAVWLPAAWPRGREWTEVTKNSAG